VATVATLYDLIPLHYPRVFFPRRRFDQRLGYGRYLRLLQCADRLIAISEATKRDAMDRLRIPSERISVTPLAVDEKRFYPRSAEEIDRAATRLGLRRPYFLHVGSPDPNKNAANILRAFDLFCRTGDSDHTLYILGKWSPQILIDAHSSDPDLVTTGRMRSLGYVSDDDLSAVYGGAEALVYPSQIEGFGLPVLEAMRCGVPVVTSHTSSLPEVSGDAALYVDPYSVEEIAEALRRLASQPDLRDLLRQRGLRQADSYSWERTARQTLRVYEEFL
jgi:glycosyltransferase involved in cell wall biosynthesis